MVLHSVSPPAPGECTLTTSVPWQHQPSCFSSGWKSLYVQCRKGRQPKKHFCVKSPADRSHSSEFCFAASTASSLHRCLVFSGISVILVTDCKYHSSIPTSPGGPFSCPLTCWLAPSWMDSLLLQRDRCTEPRVGPFLLVSRCSCFLTRAHTQTWRVVWGFKITFLFFTLGKRQFEVSDPNSSVTTGFSYGSASKPPAHREGASSATWCGHSSSFPEGLSPTVPYLQKQESKTNSTQCAVTTDKLTALLRNKHRGKQVVTFAQAYLHPACQGKHCSSWWTFCVVSFVLES